MQYRFGPFDIDAERYELRQAGVVQSVEPLVFDLLLFLVRNPARVIPRDEIVDHVWQGRAVSDATIASAIKAARRALGDSGDNQNYLRTVRGRGIEFIGDLAPADAAAAKMPPASPADGTARGPATFANTDPKPVVAVLPFSNLSVEGDEYFADGLTEDIVTNLARFRDLSVIASASAFAFKGRTVDLADLRLRLHAGYIVQGSVRRAAGRMRIAVQLVDSGSGVQLWGDRYDREAGDLFELQDEVTRTIAGTLGVTMQDVALRQALTKSATALDAYDCLLRARRYTRALSADLHAEARDLLEKAVALDPLSADVHAMLANVYLGEHRFDMNPRPNPIGRALTHALAATRLDPQNAYARCWLAIVHFFRFENEKFEAESQLALQLNPNDPETLADIGHYLAFMGEFERGAELSRRAQRLNPLHPGWYHFSFARLHYHQRAYDAVIADMQLAGLPDFYWAHLLTAAAQGQLGHPEAADTLARLLAVKPDFSAHAELKKWNAAPHDLAHLLEGLHKAGLPT